ncbi:MAG: hypothetical protein PUF72_04165 [Clostridiales bacterium]|nr:hypothetical protein [Clostridiales bacterium]
MPFGGHIIGSFKHFYGPYFDQLNQPMNPDYPSPHGEGCVLPDLVCMVNNEVFLEKD